MKCIKEYTYTRYVLIDIYISIVEKVKNVSKKCKNNTTNGWIIIILRKRIQQFFKDLVVFFVCTCTNTSCYVFLDAVQMLVDLQQGNNITKIAGLYKSNKIKLQKNAQSAFYKYNIYCSLKHVFSAITLAQSNAMQLLMVFTLMNEKIYI